jgi:hypothetical protein
MHRLLMLLSILVPLGLIGPAGCGGEKRPTADPNWKVATDPSDVVVPAGMKKAAPPAKGALPPQTR